MTLIVGILVDDSIVVLENTDRHHEAGDPPRVAAINGRSEIYLRAIVITLVDVVVFAPIAFLPGIVGKFLNEFGLVVVVATLSSLLVSFTITPTLAGNWSLLALEAVGVIDAFISARFERSGRMVRRPSAAVGVASSARRRRLLPRLALRLARPVAAGSGRRGVHSDRRPRSNGDPIDLSPGNGDRDDARSHAEGRALPRRHRRRSRQRGRHRRWNDVARGRHRQPGIGRADQRQPRRRTSEVDAILDRRVPPSHPTDRAERPSRRHSRDRNQRRRLSTDRLRRQGQRRDRPDPGGATRHRVAGQRSRGDQRQQRRLQPLTTS